MTVKPRPDRNAEGEVAKLCRALGASVQNVTEDDHGWDLLVEFPSRVQTAFPDQDPPLTRCFIQVKSNQSRRTSTRVKLSNAVKFANDPTPCFVALVTYPNGPKKPEALYLRHIWAVEMGEALKAAREASAQGRALNTRYLPIAFSAKERVDDNLAETLLDALADVGVDYAGKKSTLAGSLGYEAGWGQGQFVLAEGHGATDLEDLLLGLRKDLPIEAFSATEIRFGIEGPTTTKGPGRLSIKVKPASRCVLTVQRRDTAEHLDWPGQLFVAAGDWLPKAGRRLRVAAGPMELIISDEGEVKADWSAPLGAPRSLDDLLRDARFRSWMYGCVLDLEIWTEQGSLPASNMVFKGDREDTIDWAQAITAIQALSRVLPPERRPDDLVVSMEAFLDRLETHAQFTTLLKAEPVAMKVVNEKGLEPGMGVATHIVFPWVTRIGDYFIVSVIEREIAGFVEDDTALYFTTTRGRLLRGTAMKVSGATDALVAGEVQWARDRADASDRRILSFHPEGAGIGTLILSTPD